MSHFLANKIHDHVLRNTAYTPPAVVYLAPFEVIHTAAGTGGIEVAGGSYARQAITFAAPSAGVCANSLAAQFDAMPACTITGSALYDAATVGNMLHYAPFAAPMVVEAGTDLPITVGDIVAVLH